MGVMVVFESTKVCHYQPRWTEQSRTCSWPRSHHDSIAYYNFYNLKCHGTRSGRRRSIFPIFFYGSCGKSVKTKKHQLQANKCKEKSKRLMYLRRIIFVYQNDEGMAHPLSALQVVIYLLEGAFKCRLIARVWFKQPLPKTIRGIFP